MTGRFRTAVRATCDCLMRHRAGAVPPDHLDRPALVFAPHPDDEILGCGGTMARKLAAGARIGVVFLTDGSRTPKHAAPAEARRLRAAEACQAAAILGVPPAHMFFLGFPDGDLGRHVASACRQAWAIVKQFHPEEVYLPHRRDTHPDHRAANLVARLAIRRFSGPLRAYEYPVWCWNRWPWVPQEASGWRRLPAALGDALSFVRLLADLSVSVPIADELPVKRAALAQYRSQMSPEWVGPGGVTLEQFAGGDFLRRFFREREYFSVRATDEIVPCARNLARGR